MPYLYCTNVISEHHKHPAFVFVVDSIVEVVRYKNQEIKLFDSRKFFQCITKGSYVFT